MTDLFLGIDLGGTNTKIGLCDGKGSPRGSLSVPTLPERGAPDTVRRISEAARTLMGERGQAAACGSGVPGPLDLERQVLLRANNLPGWSRVPYPRMLGECLGIPTFMENDANCAAWGEFVAGAGRDTRSLVLYTLGTGIGGGIVLGGDLWIGASGAAGELGHMTIDPHGPPCPCGQIGCVEQYASASAVARNYGQGTAKECFEAAQRGNPAAQKAVEGATEGLATGLANLIHVLHPDIIVLAGGMALAGEYLLEKVRNGVKKRVFPPFLEKIRIEGSQVPGDDAGWLGAALWGARKVGQHEIREPTALGRTP
ncbi:MAG TPA: ROK family protein [Planctomycetota bacterium]|nr:ROK family protein [Planctomycetota bacterium]